MARSFSWLVFACACHSSPAPLPPPAASEPGGEAPAEADPRRALLEAADEVLTFLVLDEGERPALSDLADDLEELADAADAWSDLRWTELADQLREVATMARSEGDHTNAVATAAMRALRRITTSRQQDDALCWLALRVVALDVTSIETALRVAVDALNQRMLINAGMDDSGAEVSADEQEALRVDTERAAPVIEHVRASLREGPSKIEEALAELDSLFSIVQHAVDASTLAAARAQRDALPPICSR